ncbi:hypothetical protein D6821_00650 [Candidatus Parcubacteria bacterium]|nr:MAG: hypothetical protein D6821_00650 [Candidatus Parcubacteria bacterium]
MKKKPEGFSLMEAIIYFSLASAVLVSLSLFMLNLNKLKEKNYSMAEIQDTIRFSLNYFSRQVRSAQTISYPPNLGASSTLELIFSGGQSQRFYLSQEAIWAQMGTSSPQRLSSPRLRIASLEFRRLGNGVKVSLGIRPQEAIFPEFWYNENISAFIFLRKN